MSLMNAVTPEGAKTQRARILRLLIDARGAWVPTPEIAACAMQYSARLFELRKLGFRIENRLEANEQSGARQSWFRLAPENKQMPLSALVACGPGDVPAPAVDSADWYVQQTGKARPSVNQESLFLWERPR